MQRHVIGSLIVPLLLSPFLCSAEESSDISQLLLAVESCRKESPHFAETNARAYAEWRARHVQAIASIENDIDKRRQLDEAIERESQRLKSSDARGRVMLMRMCDGLIATAVGGESTLGGTDPKATWNGFVEALRRGDSDAALSFMGQSMQSQYGKAFVTMKPEGMQKFAASIGPLEIKGENGDTAEGVVMMKRGPAGVEFRKSGTRWFITSL